jgi:glycosyltransferase involved in cell wall biosynthesis
MKRQPYFSIVVPTLDEEDYLPSLLADLSEQVWRDFEVIHVDADSTDNTVGAAKKFARSLKLTQLRSDQKNVAQQRNLGAEAAAGEWIIFMDADTQIDPDFLLAVRYKIAKSEKVKNPKKPPKNKFDVFSALVSLNQNDKLKTKHKVAIQTINTRMLSSAGSDKPRLFGAMLGVRASWFGAVRFDEKVKFAEDVYFVRDLIKLGAEYKLLRSPTYYYSMRRWDDKNLLQNAAKGARLELQMAFGDEYDDVDYEMYGGRSH